MNTVLLCTCFAAVLLAIACAKGENSQAAGGSSAAVAGSSAAVAGSSAGAANETGGSYNAGGDSNAAGGGATGGASTAGAPSTPDAGNPDRRLKAIAAGGTQTCVVKKDGSVLCWGYNYHGELADGSFQDSAVPVIAQGIADAAKVTCGMTHHCALLEDGSIMCWGANIDGQLGNGTTEPLSVRNPPTPVSDLTGAVAVAAGQMHVCAIASGSAYCWGYNGQGQLGDGTKNNSLVPLQVTGLGATPVAIATGYWNSCAALSTGAVKCWGDNTYGQLGSGQLGSGTGETGVNAIPTPVKAAGISNAANVASGYANNCVVLSDGGIMCMGDNRYGQLGNGQQATSTIPVKVVDIDDGVAVAIGWWHTCAVLRSGSVRCWGQNLYGQLGDGTTTDSAVPVSVKNITNAAAVAVGSYHSCAMLDDGTVKCWGLNANGQLGNGDTTGVPSTAEPIDVPGL